MSDSGGQSRNARLGLAFFAVYTVLYAAFVGIAAFGTFAGGAAAGGLSAQAILGLPWGVVAGFGLIGGAFILAVLYAVMAGRGGEG